MKSAIQLRNNKEAMGYVNKQKKVGRQFNQLMASGRNHVYYTIVKTVSKGIENQDRVDPCSLAG